MPCADLSSTCLSRYLLEVQCVLYENGNGRESTFTQNMRELHWYLPFRAPGFACKCRHPCGPFRGHGLYCRKRDGWNGDGDRRYKPMALFLRSKTPRAPLYFSLRSCRVSTRRSAQYHALPGVVLHDMRRLLILKGAKSRGISI